MNKGKHSVSTPPIKTHTGESFSENYIQPESEKEALLKADFGRFFIVRVEDMIRRMKLPVPPTRTTNHTLIFLTKGEAVMHIGAETYTIGRNECLMVPAGQVFSFSQVDLNQGYLCNIHNDFIIGKFGKADLLKEYEFLRVWGNPRISLNEPTADFVAHLLSRMLVHYSHHGLTHPDRIQASFIALLCELNHAYQPTSVSSSTQAVLTTNRFKELLFTHIKTHHLVADYAGLLNLTPNHLNKSVKAVTGRSPTNWIDEDHRAGGQGAALPDGPTHQRGGRSGGHDGHVIFQSPVQKKGRSNPPRFSQND